MQKKWILLAMVGLYLVSGLYVYYRVTAVIPRVPYDSDEIAWFYHTKFLDLIIGGNITDPAWQSLEAYDHPPLSKYFYGVYLKFHYGDYSHQRSALVHKYGDWYHLKIPEIRTTEFVSYINLMRKSNMLGATLIIIFISLYTYRLTRNIFIALMNAVWLSHTDKLIQILLRAVSDTHYLLLLCVSLALFLLYLEKHSVKLLVVSAILAALSVSAKLSGFIYFIIIPIFLTMDIMISKISVRNYLRSLLIVFTVGMFTWIIINPTLYPAPISNSRMYYLMRQSIMVYQLNEPHNASQVLPTIQSKVSAVFCTIFNHKWMRNCSDWNLTRFVYLNILLFIAGLGFLVKKTMRQHDKSALFALLFLYFITNYIIAFSPFAWDRYYLPLVLVVSVIFSCGIYALLTGFVRYGKLLIFNSTGIRRRKTGWKII